MKMLQDLLTKLKNTFSQNTSSTNTEQLLPQESATPTPATGAARKIVDFLRKREHEFNYKFTTYPVSDDWQAGSKWKDIKRSFGGKSNQVLNCSGLVLYTHFKTGLVTKNDLQQRAILVKQKISKLSTASLIADSDEGQPVDKASKPKASEISVKMLLRELCRDLVGNATSAPLDSIDFGSIQPGSTVLFAIGNRPMSHVAVMLDNGQMAHLMQTVTDPEAVHRPDIAAGHLEITTPDKVITLVKSMPGGNGQINVSFTNGPQNFIAANVSDDIDTPSEILSIASNANASITSYQAENSNAHSSAQNSVNPFTDVISGVPSTSGTNASLDQEESFRVQRRTSLPRSRTPSIDSIRPLPNEESQALLGEQNPGKKQSKRKR